jgi:hypothetical protein
MKGKSASGNFHAIAELPYHTKTSRPLGRRQPMPGWRTQTPAPFQHLVGSFTASQ